MVKFERVADGRLEQVWINDRLVGHVNQKGTLLIDTSNLKDYVGVIGITEEDLRKIFKRGNKQRYIASKIYSYYFDDCRCCYNCLILMKFSLFFIYFIVKFVNNVL